jgi:hypothetical protein
MQLGSLLNPSKKGTSMLNRFSVPEQTREWGPFTSRKETAQTLGLGRRNLGLRSQATMCALQTLSTGVERGSQLARCCFHLAGCQRPSGDFIAHAPQPRLQSCAR